MPSFLLFPSVWSFDQNLWTWGNNVCAVLSELHFPCLQEHFEEKKFLSRKLFSNVFFYSDFKKMQTFARKSRFCQIWFLRLLSNLLISILQKKLSFFKIYRNLSQIFSILCYNYSTGLFNADFTCFLCEVDIFHQFFCFIFLAFPSGLLTFFRHAQINFSRIVWKRSSTCPEDRFDPSWVFEVFFIFGIWAAKNWFFAKSFSMRLPKLHSTCSQE